MTDHQPLGRIDLRAIDEPGDPGRIDRIVASVLRQVTSDDLLGATDLLSRLGGLARPAMAAAAILLLCATAVLRWNDRAARAPLGSLSSWAAADRVPTNGELLAAFEGYER
jgi:hypothetical protein